MEEWDHRIGGVLWPTCDCQLFFPHSLSRLSSLKNRWDLSFSPYNFFYFFPLIWQTLIWNNWQHHVGGSTLKIFLSGLSQDTKETGSDIRESDLSNEISRCCWDHKPLSVWVKCSSTCSTCGTAEVLTHWSCPQTGEAFNTVNCFALVIVVVIALLSRTQSRILSILVVGKTEITSLSWWTILSSHTVRQRADGRF